MNGPGSAPLLVLTVEKGMEPKVTEGAVPAGGLTNGREQDRPRFNSLS